MSFPQTIHVKFDVETLPTWARKLPQVVELCKRDLAFRCNVCRAETSQYRRLCIREAQYRISESRY